MKSKITHYMFPGIIFTLCVIYAALNFAISLAGFLLGDIWVGLAGLLGCCVLSGAALYVLDIKE